MIIITKSQKTLQGVQLDQEDKYVREREQKSLNLMDPSSQSIKLKKRKLKIFRQIISKKRLKRCRTYNPYIGRETLIKKKKDYSVKCN